MSIDDNGDRGGREGRSRAQGSSQGPAPLLSWETVTREHRYVQPLLKRTRVPGGWLVWAEGYDRGGLAYVPDPDREWIVRVEREE